MRWGVGIWLNHTHSKNVKFLYHCNSGLVRGHSIQETRDTQGPFACSTIQSPYTPPIQSIKGSQFSTNYWSSLCLEVLSEHSWSKNRSRGNKSQYKWKERILLFELPNYIKVSSNSTQANVECFYARCSKHKKDWFECAPFGERNNLKMLQQGLNLGIHQNCMSIIVKLTVSKSLFNHLRICNLPTHVKALRPVPGTEGVHSKC